MNTYSYIYLPKGSVICSGNDIYQTDSKTHGNNFILIEYFAQIAQTAMWFLSWEYVYCFFCYILKNWNSFYIADEVRAIQIKYIISLKLVLWGLETLQN